MELKQNLLDQYVIKNICRNNANCYICIKLHQEKDARLEKIEAKLKTVEQIIKKRGIERKSRIEKMLARTIN